MTSPELWQSLSVGCSISSLLDLTTLLCPTEHLQLPLDASHLGLETCHPKFHTPPLDLKSGQQITKGRLTLIIKFEFQSSLSCSAFHSPFFITHACATLGLTLLLLPYLNEYLLKPVSNWILEINDGIIMSDQDSPGLCVERDSWEVEGQIPEQNIQILLIERRWEAQINTPALPSWHPGRCRLS